MARYMIQATYTPQAWAAMVKNPVDRGAAVRALLEKAGGRLESIYFCFGENDVIVIAEMPDNVTAAAVALAANSAGHLRSLSTTVLMTVEEIMAAERKAGDLTYSGPT
jgi:uncharacterized protein with GYD domain